MLRLVLTLLVAFVAAADKIKCSTADDCKDAGEADTCTLITWEAEDAEGVNKES